jgi:large subunit ribosomal protein L20
MARVKRNAHALKKHREVLRQARGYRGQRSKLYRKAREQLYHSYTYAFRDRRKNKGNFRRLWIQRINIASRQYGLSYNKFIQGLKIAEIEVDRKILAYMAVEDQQTFEKLVKTAEKSLKKVKAN